ncbi:lysophospholipase [Mollisia scopiformis]|uniref:Lysophospholipase n=1 Tax=Mollisia scopiformis TaxID=149040 RepID=A0A194X2D8_MOLSC|nr:lysophospholipase [Mollisia scopiformis]KUJ14356.1 lysophospholipase [Mollisia scopiformis]
MLGPLLLSAVFSVVPVFASYAPQKEICPITSIVRAANGLSDDEETYRVARKAVADVALKAWLAKTDSGFGTDNLPTVAITTSGGGYRSLLSGAGVIQALDDRDSNGTTSGLYQAMTYQAGLSGGAWLLSSIAGNNYPTVSYLKENLWHEAFRDSLLDPDFLLASVAYVEVVSDIAEKDAAGYDVTLTDPWGRLLSYQLLDGTDGGVSTTLSSITGFSNFTSHAVPFPVITSLGVKVWEGQCLPGPNATTYEFSPYEFGSWDSDVSAFVQTHYLGTSMSEGKPTGLCTTNYDNLGYVLGTSSTLFNELCLSVPTAENSSTDIYDDLAAILNRVHEVTTSDLYATYPNPFYDYISSTAVSNIANNVSAQDHLSLVDGGEALQNNPIFPFLQPARNISVILVNDNSADTSTNYPNGSEILTTYVQSFNHNLTLMPFIPSVETFISEGLNTRATFFGCNDTSKITIVYLPNYNFTFDSGVSTSQLEYSETEQDEMVTNGNAIAEQGGKDGWATCLGCAIMMKTGETLASGCTACLEEYCYYQ